METSSPLEQLEKELTALAACGHELVVFQVLDPAELSFSFNQPAMFEDLESHRFFFIDPRSARKDYLSRLQQHCSRLRATCERLGISCLRLDTSRPLELALFDFLRERMQRRPGSKRVSRQQTSAALSVTLA